MYKLNILTAQLKHNFKPNGGSYQQDKCSLHLIKVLDSLVRRLRLYAHEAFSLLFVSTRSNRKKKTWRHLDSSSSILKATFYITYTHSGQQYIEATLILYARRQTSGRHLHQQSVLDYRRTVFASSAPSIVRRNKRFFCCSLHTCIFIYRATHSLLLFRNAAGRETREVDSMLVLESFQHQLMEYSRLRHFP